jgi:hypothetical protein
MHGVGGGRYAEIQNLFYFPNLNSDLSNLEAVQRFNFYQFNSLPKTVVMGNQRFHQPWSKFRLIRFSSSRPSLRRRMPKVLSCRFSCEISPADTINSQNRNFSFSLQNERTHFENWNSGFRLLFMLVFSSKTSFRAETAS